MKTKSTKTKEQSIIDRDGFRLNVGIILINDQQQVLVARRAGHANAWQFPQGGLMPHETAAEALYRELYEELGLKQMDVECLAHTRQWLRYRLPIRYRRVHQKPLCIGQKQKWFLLRLISDEKNISLQISDKPEFDVWRWTDYWQPIDDIIAFKRRVYQRALREFAPLVLKS